MILDDLKAGDFVTVLEWKPREVPVWSDHDSWQQVGTRTVQDTSWKGEVLTVDAVDLPYVVVHEARSRQPRAIALDTRRVTLKLLSPQYVNAMVG